MSRRSVLAGAGILAAGAVSGSVWYQHSRPAPAVTLSRWQARRGGEYYIAHRGGGDVVPEHTLPAYEAALAWGAQAIEISTSGTADGVLICMHDLTYDRTTTGRGVIADQPSSVLTGIGVTQPQLGPHWSTAPLTPVPLLDDVLRRLAGRAVLCIQAKRDADYDAVIALIEKHRLQRSVILKFFHTSAKIEAARAAGYPVFVYLGSSDLSQQVIDAAAARLDRARDYLVIPTYDGTGPLSDTDVHVAVGTGVPIWVYPVHRRVEARRFFDLGVAGVITSSLGYSRQALAPATVDNWAAGAVAPGQLTRDPSAPVFAPRWNSDGSLTLNGKGIGQHFLCLGQFGAIGKNRPSWIVDFDARWDRLPTDRKTNLTLAFGHADDRYYEHRLGVSSGYHAIQRVDGSLELYRHVAGSTVGRELAPAKALPAPQEGAWMHFTLQVDPARIGWRSGADPVHAITVDDTGEHGGYLHVGRSANDGELSLRNFQIS